jgi:hypothetical protein
VDHAGIEVVDLPVQLPRGDGEGAEIVLTVRIVIVGKGLEVADGEQRCRDELRTPRDHTRGHADGAADKSGAKGVIEDGDLSDLVVIEQVIHLSLLGHMPELRNSALARAPEAKSFCVLSYRWGLGGKDGTTCGLCKCCGLLRRR